VSSKRRAKESSNIARDGSSEELSRFENQHPEAAGRLGISLKLLLYGAKPTRVALDVTQIE
jgi:hypothetical protein